jgi:pimeloyl-ACP methyl ester carboxylesterase
MPETRVSALAVIAILECVRLAMFAASPVFAQDVSAPPRPAPGRLIDIGGWRLHLHCTGEIRPNGPTVILEAGLGDFSEEWSLVQPRVATFARVCSYDRGGDGWSDLGPSPRTLHQIVYELHTLLQKADERPPYFMVGHSYGGWLVQLYASTYPLEIRGLALIESGESDPLRLTGPDGSAKRSSEIPAGRPIPPIKTATPLRESDVPPGPLSQMKEAASRARLDPNPGERQKLPVEAQAMRAWALGRWQHIAATFNPVELEELAALRADHAKSVHPLGDRPLIVVTRGRPDETGPNVDALEAEHRQDHTKLAALSANGKLIVAQQSGHHVQLDQPELVEKTIADLIPVSSPTSK